MVRGWAARRMLMQKSNEHEYIDIGRRLLGQINGSGRLTFGLISSQSDVFENPKLATVLLCFLLILLDILPLNLEV